MKSKTIAIDFDGTIVKHAYPEIGEPIHNAIETILRLQEEGHKIILYTMRSGERLDQAVEFLVDEGIELYGVNRNPTQHHWTESKKVFANYYIDDCALGIPLEGGGSRPWVNWISVECELEDKGIL